MFIMVVVDKTETFFLLSANIRRDIMETVSIFTMSQTLKILKAPFNILKKPSLHAIIGQTVEYIDNTLEQIPGVDKLFGRKINVKGLKQAFILYIKRTKMAIKIGSPSESVSSF